MPVPVVSSTLEIINPSETQPALRIYQADNLYTLPGLIEIVAPNGTLSYITAGGSGGALPTAIASNADSALEVAPAPGSSVLGGGQVYTASQVKFGRNMTVDGFQGVLGVQAWVGSYTPTQVQEKVGVLSQVMMTVATPDWSGTTSTSAIPFLGQGLVNSPSTNSTGGVTIDQTPRSVNVVSTTGFYAGGGVAILDNGVSMTYGGIGSGPTRLTSCTIVSGSKSLFNGSLIAGIGYGEGGLFETTINPATDGVSVGVEIGLRNAGSVGVVDSASQKIGLLLSSHVNEPSLVVNITSTTNRGDGVIRVTGALTARPGQHGLATGDVVIISGVTGSSNVNNGIGGNPPTWTVNVDGSGPGAFDLTGSSWDSNGSSGTAKRRNKGGTWAIITSNLSNEMGGSWSNGVLLRQIDNVFISMNSPTMSGAIGIDMQNNTNWGSAIVLPNNVPLRGHAVAGGTNYALAYIDGTNSVVLGSVAANATIQASSTITLGANTSITGSLDMGTHRITSVVDPAANQDVATKIYCDTHGPVTGVFGRTGAVVATSGDYTAAQVTNAADKSSSSTQSFTGGVVSVHATAGIGYATGAGGAVTQITSRTTTVTLNKVTGRITTFNSSMTTGAIFHFTVNNSTVTIGDTVLVTDENGPTTSGTSAGPFTSNVQNGSFVINYTNNSTGSDSTAIVFNFVVIKAVNS